jgi:integrase/recombinase XerD
MTDSLFRRSYYWKRLRANPLGKIIEEYVQHFCGLGYSWLTVRGYVQSLEHFGSWLQLRRLDPKAVNGELIRSFIRDHLPKCRCSYPAPVTLTQVRPALNHLLRLLREKGILCKAGRHWPIDLVIEQFAVYLREVGGLSEATCVTRTRYAREFLEMKFGRRKPRWTALQPKDVLSFVKTYAQRARPSSTQVAASSIRCFLRYLQAQGWCRTSLVAAVPSVALWKLSSLPKVLSEDQVREFLSTFDRSQAVGLRDYAMALCQIVLGLRVSEVANLKLDDFHWHTGTVRINAGKVLRTHELPLPVQVGNALVRYLRDGRLPTKCRNVFVRHRGACGAPVSTALIRGAMRLAYAKMRGGAHWGGTHVLRHTAATRMLQYGASLKEIADVLGHHSIQTTTIYTKIDFRRLTAVASPWPEVRS